MTILSVRFSILPDKLREFEQAVGWLSETRGLHQGTDRVRLYRRWGCERAEFLYQEILPEGEDVQEHLDSEKFRTLLGAIKVLGEIGRASVITAREARSIE